MVVMRSVTAAATATACLGRCSGPVGRIDLVAN